MARSRAQASTGSSVAPIASERETFTLDGIQSRAIPIQASCLMARKTEGLSPLRKITFSPISTNFRTPLSN